METEGQRERILNGKPWKILIDFSWPAVAAMFLLGANNVLDGLFVGHFAEAGGLAGRSIAGGDCARRFRFADRYGGGGITEYLDRRE